MNWKILSKKEEFHKDRILITRTYDVEGFTVISSGFLSKLSTNTIYIQDIIYDPNSNEIYNGASFTQPEIEKIITDYKKDLESKSSGIDLDALLEQIEKIKVSEQDIQKLHEVLIVLSRKFEDEAKRLSHSTNYWI